MSLADEKTFPVVATEQEERDAQFSSNGKWIAYQTNESGRFEIWVRRFRPPGTDVPDGNWKISTAGGVQARWRWGGKELFYVALDGRLMAVPIRETLDGSAIERGTPVPLGAPLVPLLFDGGAALPSYAVAERWKPIPDDHLPPPVISTPATLHLNWPPRRD